MTSTRERRCVISLISLIVVACDPLHRPAIRNDLDYTINIEVEYESGYEANVILGAGETLWAPSSDAGIRSIAVSSGGGVLFSLSQADIVRLAQTAEGERIIGWNVTEAGVVPLSESQWKALTR